MELVATLGLGAVLSLGASIFLTALPEMLDRLFEPLFIRLLIFLAVRRGE